MEGGKSERKKEEEEEEEEEVKLEIKYGGGSISVRVSPESRVGEVKMKLQSLTNVLPRGQKLIHKGRILIDSNSLKSCGITNASNKMMLLATPGLHQGVKDGPKLRDAPVVPNYRKIRDGNSSSSSNSNSNSNRSNSSNSSMDLDLSASSARWKLTGVVSLCHCNLKCIPPEVLCCSSSARVVDLSYNSISHIPPSLSSFSSLHKLIFTSNSLTLHSISWDSLSLLPSLSFLSFSHNLLTSLPSSLGSLTSLQHLHVSSNQLSTIPVQIRHLTRLQILKLDHNRLNTIPPSIGDCTSLTEIDVSSNLLVELPETMGSLQNLKSLRLGNNGLKSLPSSIFKRCVKLSTLDLHGTQITMDMLREVEGWQEFDERRRLKYQKQLDFRAGGSAEFDEGADQNL